MILLRSEDSFSLFEREGQRIYLTLRVYVVENLKRDQNISLPDVTRCVDQNPERINRIQKSGECRLAAECSSQDSSWLAWK